jgi:hypothetical protein
MSTVPSSAPSSGGHRPTNAATGNPARGAVRRLTLGSGPLKRISDRIEMLSRFVLAVVLTLAAPVALAAANGTAAELRATAQQEAATRNQVPAVLLEDAAPRAYADPDTTTAGAGIITRTDGTWIEPDGTTSRGEVPARPGMRAGETVHVWIDGDGALTSAPLRDSDVTAGTVVAGGGTFVLIVTAAGAAHGLVCWTLNRHRDRRWSADWAAVEPTWSGRLR